jgi:farnesyl-diphosphate farnesyltransferase
MSGMANLDDLLEKTSRTFALSIPLLPDPTRHEVSVAYLLFRIADTFEDAELWAPAERRKALADFADLLARAEPAAAERLADAWTRNPPCGHAGYLELLRETPSVLADFESLSEPAQSSVRAHVRRSAEGMAGFVSRMTPAGDLVLDDLADLSRYCYAVAGIVGEMLTELFLIGRGFGEIEPFLRERAAEFGEGLQLVNILKDSFSDLKQGRRYLPPGVERSEVFSLARHDLGRAAEYVLALQKSGAPRGLVGFTALPVELAWASLDRIEKFGAGAKVSRPEVFLIAKRLERALDQNEPAVFSISCSGRRT